MLNDMRHNDVAVRTLAALSYKGVGRAWVNRNLSGTESSVEIVDRLNEKLKLGERADSAGFADRCRQVSEQLSCLPIDMKILVRGDAEFPLLPDGMPDADRPVVLFVRGDCNLLRDRSRNVAVIGELEPSRDTMEEERTVTRELVENGICIVSGLACGCDTVAHETALAKGGKTIAVLPCPLGTVVPAENKGLAERILSGGGALVSEYYLKPCSKYEYASRFVERDRLQAALSTLVLLAASHDVNTEGYDSGSRHALEKAKRYGIPRAVIYDASCHGRLGNYDLNRRIVTEDGAQVVMDPMDSKASVRRQLSRSDYRHGTCSQLSFFG